MKEKVQKEYLRRVKLVAGSALSAGKLLRAVNAWAVNPDLPTGRGWPMRGLID